MAKRREAKQMKLFDDGAPAEEKAGPWPEDKIIRSGGFRIHARPAAGYDAATWTREGRLYSHDQALGLAVTEGENKKRRSEAEKKGEI